MNKNLWNIKKTKYIFKRCIPLTLYVKKAWKFAFQKIRKKPTHNVIKSYTLPTISNCRSLIMQFSWMSVFLQEKIIWNCSLGKITTNFSKILKKYLWRSSFYSKVAGSMPAILLKMNSFLSIFLEFC